ncbi:hypothetical protein ACEN4E_07900 [Latilactobacillus sakei]|uniref:hypothetical protein n=1 Tax=Latilactobacillus sakei TaxID=1599 RepID=UPI00388450C4
MNKNSEAPLMFDGYKINYIKYFNHDVENDVEEIESSINVGFALSKDLKNGLVVQTVGFVNTDRNISGKIKITGQYTFVEGLDKEQSEQLLAQNGAAMLYPYLRTIVSIISGLDEDNVSVLPSLNFRDAYLESRKDKQA